MFNRIAATIHGLFSSRQGSVAVQVGVGLVALLGVAGLGTEGTFLLYKQRQMQTVADSAALSAAMALGSGRTPTTEARGVAANMGFISGAGGVSVAVASPPTTGPYAGNSDAVEVTVSQPQAVALLRLFGDQQVGVHARAVGRRSQTGRFCVLALDESAAQAVYMSNNAEMQDPSCGVAINSDSNTSLVMNNNAAIAGPVLTRGEWDLANNADLSGMPLIENGPMTADPYADVAIGANMPGCPGQLGGSGSNNVVRTLHPGRYCSGWDFTNNVTLTLEQGTYYIDTKMSLKNNVIVNATTGVTIVVNGNYAIDLGNNAAINITAPSTGDYAGLALVGGRTSTSSVVQKFSNNAVLNVQGAIYFPNQTVEIDNNGFTTSTGCTHIIGRKVRLMNNANMPRSDCEGTGVRPISAPAQLVE